jgi:GTP cyclohydrolase II
MKFDPELLAAERAIDEVRCGRPVVVVDHAGATIYAPVETITALLALHLREFGDGGLSLVVSEERAIALGVDKATAAGAFTLPLSADMALLEMMKMATSDPQRPDDNEMVVAAPGFPGNEVDGLIVRLLKTAWLLPVALKIPVIPLQAREFEGLLACGALHAVTSNGLTRLFESLDESVVKISEARIPLADAPDARFVCFRTAVACREHLAILIGTPDCSAGVPVRLHSACLTGDVFGSLRCDCGDQLRQTIVSLQALGGGVLLYLAQEGRGIGLANKLRAYSLQDGGRDTIDADLQLGFSPDERQYGIAATMLRSLGYDRIRLLTNNPDKIEALAKAGITIVDRLPLLGCITPQNQRYMDAKRTRAHHLLDGAAG